MKDIILGACAVVGTALGIFNLVKASLKERREKKLRERLNLVKAEYRAFEPGSGEPKRLLYMMNSDIRPVSNVRVTFCGENGETVKELTVSSLTFGGECFVDRSTGKRRIRRAEITYTDYDGREHRYTQEEIHSP